MRSRGFSIFEIVLALALTTLFLIPLVTLLYSLHPFTIMHALGVEEKGIASGNTYSTTWLDRYVFGRVDSTRGIYTTHIDDMEIQGKTNCDAVSLATSTTHLYTNAELGLSTTSIPSSIVSVGSYLFLSLNSSSTTEPDFVSYKILPDTTLQKVGSIDTGPGIIDSTIAMMTVFVGNTSVNSQAQRINVTNSASSTVVQNYVFIGANSTTKPVTKKIALYKNLLIVGTEKSVLPEIEIFDINSGTPVASIETGYGINGFFVRDRKLFVLSPLDPEVDVYDMRSVLTNEDLFLSGVATSVIQPRKLYTYDAPGVLGNGRSIDIAGDSVVLGRSKGGDELSLLSYAPFDATSSMVVSSTTPTIQVDSSIIKTSLKIGASIDVTISGLTHLFIFTGSPIKRIMEYSVSTSSFSLLNTYNTTDRVASAYCNEYGMYVALQSSSTPLLFFKNI